VVTVATVPGEDTVTGCGPFAFAAADADGLPLAAMRPPGAAGAAGTALNVAAPVGAAAGLAAPDDRGTGGRCPRRRRDHRYCSVPEPGADGGRDLVIDVTAT
jgi:hypothetical protein